MALGKAKSAQRFLRVSIYGPAGSGKTLTALMCGEVLAAMEKSRIGMWDSEHGSDFYLEKVAARACHPEAFDFDADYDKSLSGITRMVTTIKGKTHRVLIIDSMTHVWQAAIDSYQGKKANGGQLPIYAWGPIKSKYRVIMDACQNFQGHVFLLGREGVEYGEDEKGEEGVIGKKMKAESETQYEMNMSIRMERVGQKKRGSKSDVRAIVEKDRTGIMQGKVIINPTFETLLKPLMRMLTADKQGKVQTHEEIQRKDAEHFAQSDHGKESKSEKIKLELRQGLNACTSLEDLKFVYKEMQSKKPQMSANDVSITRHLYEEKLDQMKEDTDPEKGREKLLGELERVIQDWDADQLGDFCKLHLDGRTPGWPDEFSNGDLRLLKNALQQHPEAIAKVLQEAS